MSAETTNRLICNGRSVAGASRTVVCLYANVFGPGDRIASRRDAYLDQVRKIVLDALAGYSVTVCLFGSCATGSTGRTSDVDVDAHEPLPPHLLAGLRDALEESTIPYRVDIVDLSTSSDALRRSVREEGKVWKSYARS